MSAIEIPGYKIIRTLGVGGQATVYLAIQTGFEREVALKIMSPILAADPTFGERFIREAKIVAKLSHKSIVTVYDAGESGNFYYLAMEYMPGGDLKKRIENGMKARECLDVISDLATALNFAHEKGYIHRDVKSENILFNEDDEPVLTDFGIAKASNSSTQMTQTGKLIGTPEYMSPEQCRGKKIDGRSDLYSLGIILYEMLTRSVPFTGEDSVSVCIKHVTSPLPELPVRLKHFQWLLDLLLVKDPEQRFQTGAELAKAVNEFKKTGTQTSEIGTINFKQALKKDKKSSRSSNKTVISDASETNDFIDDLHTERRITQVETKSAGTTKLFVGLILLTLGASVGFVTKDRWFGPASDWVNVNLLGKNKLEQQSDKDLASSDVKQLNKQNTAAFDSSKKRQQPAQENSAAQNNLAQQASELTQTEKDSGSTATNSGSGNNGITNINGNNGSDASNSSTNVTDMLQEADRLVQYVPHTLEDKKQALKLIATINTLEPQNSSAKSLYENILTLSLGQATELAENESFDGASEWLTLVEYEKPDHVLLSATKEKIQRFKVEYESKENDRLLQQESIANLLKNAELAMADNRLSSPAKNNAVFYFEQVIELDLDNQTALSGLESVEAIYLSKTEKAINENSYSLAKSLLLKYSALSKNEVKKNSLHDRILKGEEAFKIKSRERERLAQIEKQQVLQEQERQERLSDPMVQMQLNSSLAGAKDLEEQMLLVEPENNSALDKYKKALAIDDRNAEAKQGIVRIEQTIVTRLNNAITISDRAEALKWLDKLRIFDPKSKQILSFEDQIINMPAVVEKEEPLPESETVLEQADQLEKPQTLVEDSLTVKSLEMQPAAVLEKPITDNLIDEKQIENKLTDKLKDTVNDGKKELSSDKIGEEKAVEASKNEEDTKDDKPEDPPLN